MFANSPDVSSVCARRIAPDPAPSPRRARQMSSCTRRRLSRNGGVRVTACSADRARSPAELAAILADRRKSCTGRRLLQSGGVCVARCLTDRARSRTKHAPSPRPYQQNAEEHALDAASAVVAVCASRAARNPHRARGSPCRPEKILHQTPICCPARFPSLHSASAAASARTIMPSTSFANA